MTLSEDDIGIRKMEFENDAPLEYREISPLEKLEKVFEKEKQIVQERKDRMKQNPPALKLNKAPKKIHRFKAKDYIALRCQICQMDFTTARKDEEGNFEPRALCQHVVLKGVVAEE